MLCPKELFKPDGSYCMLRSIVHLLQRKGTMLSLVETKAGPQGGGQHCQALQARWTSSPYSDPTKCMHEFT